MGRNVALGAALPAIPGAMGASGYPLGKILKGRERAGTMRAGQRPRSPAVRTT